jgi:outer membrane protein assembly factor BamB
MKRLLAIISLICATGLAENWPSFRGPTRQGISTERDLAVSWSATSNVVWKTDITPQGWSSPIIWNERVFVTGTTTEGVVCHLLCLDRATGKLLWDREVLRQQPGKKRAENSYATPTPVTDGERVYAVFNSGSFVAVDFSGTAVWTNTPVSYYSEQGLGASPVLYQDLLIMPFDGSSPGADKTLGWQKAWDQAFVLALDKRTGMERWRARRGMSRLGWATPGIYSEHGQAQLVSNAGNVVQGFDLTSGERIWTAFSKGEGPIPSIVFGHGLIFTTSGWDAPKIRAIRCGGQGDITATHIAWEQGKGVPMQASMLFVEPHLYAVTDGGIATCYQASTGTMFWQERLGSGYSASPVFGDDRIYFLSQDGETVVIGAGSSFEILARSPLNERCQASMGISGGGLFIRTEKSLYCIGKPHQSP